MDENELFDLLENPVASTTSKKETQNLWDKSNFTAKEIDVSRLSSPNKTFTVMYHLGTGRLPSDILNKFSKVSKFLATKGYSFRNNGSETDIVETELSTIPDLNIENYIPWKKYNSKAIKPCFPIEEAYCIAARYHKSYSKLPPAIRALLASKIHTLLGKELTEPVELILSYVKGGYEAIDRSVSYKEIGNLSFPYSVAGDTNIPVFNLDNENAITRVVEYIKSKHNF